MHPDLQALDVSDIVDLLLGVHVAHALRSGRDHMQALRGLVDHGLERLEHFWIGQTLDHVVLVAEQEVQRHHARLRCDRRGVGRGDDRELDVARLHELEHLRLLPELRARILIDDHGAFAQFLELLGKKVARDGIAGVARLVVGEAIMLHLLRRCARDEQDRGRRRQPM
ncbi:hypothetical protein ACVWZ6_003901 [Bradyrhizobium sp. GM6.1]